MYLLSVYVFGIGYMISINEEGIHMSRLSLFKTRMAKLIIVLFIITQTDIICVYTGGLNDEDFPQSNLMHETNKEVYTWASRDNTKRVSIFFLFMSLDLITDIYKCRYLLCNGT